MRTLILILALIAAQSYADDLFNGCGLDGQTLRANIKLLNRLKNRTTPPKTSEINTNITLQAVLRKGRGGDWHRWSVTNGASIVGYVYDIKPGGEETCNCGATNLVFRDTHIELTLSDKASDTVKKKRMIVEVTPRIRKKMADKGVDWSTDGLRDKFLHQRVRVEGWMFFDAEHDDESWNTTKNNPDIWRATAWEIHPVTRIEVINP